MAFLFCDSFDHYVTADISEKWSAGSLVVGAGAGRRGSAAFRADFNQFNAVTRTLPVTNATAIIGVAYKPTTIISHGSGTFLQIRAGGTTMVGRKLSAAGFIEAWRGSAYTGTLLGTATTGALTTGAFAYVEVKALIHPSAGTITVRVDNAVVLTLSGQNTGGSSWDNVQLANTDSGGFGANWYYDDLYILDGAGAAPWNDFLGDCRVDARVPTGAGATTAWTPSTGANWQNVDDANPDDDSTYNSTPT